MTKLIAGFDEVGWGAVAGPVYFGYTVFPEDQEFPDFIKDSKRLSARKRLTAYQWILEHAVDYHVFKYTVPVIDSLGLGACRRTAVELAAHSLKNVSDDPRHLYLDGKFNVITQFRSKVDVELFNWSVQNVTAVVGGDDSIKACSAASIVAKVERDRYMKSLDRKHPEYHLAQHKGYGTKLHQEALAQHGPLSSIHRYSTTLIQKYVK